MLLRLINNFFIESSSFLLFNYMKQEVDLYFQKMHWIYDFKINVHILLDSIKLNRKIIFFYALYIFLLFFFRKFIFGLNYYSYLHWKNLQIIHKIIFLCNKHLMPLILMNEGYFMFFPATINHFVKEYMLNLLKESR